MGNLCSKSSNQPDNFAGQGRVVGSSTTRSNAPASAPIPPQVSSSSPGRTTGQGQGSSLDAADARSAAARAAEVGHPCQLVIALWIANGVTPLQLTA